METRCKVFCSFKKWFNHKLLKLIKSNQIGHIRGKIKINKIEIKFSWFFYKVNRHFHRYNFRIKNISLQFELLNPSKKHFQNQKIEMFPKSCFENKTFVRADFFSILLLKRAELNLIKVYFFKLKIKPIVFIRTLDIWELKRRHWE